jgi:hypothetical protein
MFPENVGYPLKMVDEGPYYYMMEMHYNNPTFDTFEDYSGIRAYYTDVLREFDMGLLHFGMSVTPFQVYSIAWLFLSRHEASDTCLGKK